MGAENIEEGELRALGVEIVSKSKSGYYKIRIPDAGVEGYKELVRQKMQAGFWNEFVGKEEIYFIFKFLDGSLKEFVLSKENEPEISKLTAEFNHEPPGKTDIVYKYLSENDFYRDFMFKYYSRFIPQP